MANYRIQRLDGTLEGPFSSADLKNLASSGRISPADRVAVDGSDRWVPAARVNGIREILEARAVAPDGPEPEPPTATIPLEPRAIPPIPSRSAPSTTYASDPDPPQYGMLRCVAGWIIFYGWLVVALGFTFSYLMTVLLARSAMGSGTPWSGGFIAIIVLLCLAAGAATTAAVRSFANRNSRVTGVFGAVVLLPIVPFTLDGIRKGTISTLEGILLLQIVGTSLSSLIVGSALVAIGEFLVAHADIATNSWRRAAGR